MTEPRVGRAAYLLGVAGLLPQVAAVGLIVLGRVGSTDLAWIPVVVGYGLALLYGGLILSFLGGIWWGLAMRRPHRQAPLVVLAVLPSLTALACLAWTAGMMPSLPSPWIAVGLGSAIMLTLLVDRRLVRSGEAPDGWMRLRIPLSLGLGGLTIAAGLLLAL